MIVPLLLLLVPVGVLIKMYDPKDKLWHVFGTMLAFAVTVLLCGIASWLMLPSHVVRQNHTYQPIKHFKRVGGYYHYYVVQPDGSLLAESAGAAYTAVTESTEPEALVTTETRRAAPAWFDRYGLLDRTSTSQTLRVPVGAVSY